MECFNQVLRTSVEMIGLEHRDATVIADEDAASELTMRDYYEFIYAAKPAAPKT